MYLMCGTRPDLAYAVGVLARSVSEPQLEHFALASRVLGYVKTTAGLGVFYQKGYADADWGGGLVDRKSVSGFEFTFCGSVVSWGSKKQ